MLYYDFLSPPTLPHKIFEQPSILARCSSFVVLMRVRTRAPCA